MSPFSTNRKVCLNKNGGFALVIALSLMAFVLVLLLSMTTLVQVESQSASISKSTMEARMNAQLGMQVALGELQAAMGPDARVSANASILDSNPSTAVIDGVEHAHWLGVYPTVNPSSVNDSLLDPRALRDWSLGEVKWLVSEGRGSNLDPTTALTNDTVTLAQFIDDATTNLPDINTIESLPASSLSNAKAELVEIEGSAQAKSSGRYAWWVGDESMKARVNTQASELGDDVLSGTQVDADQQQQANYEVTQGTNFSTWLPGYKDDLNSLDKILAPTGLEFLAIDSNNTQWLKWSALNWDKFTPYSQSLPVDVVNGRLKQDLTAYFKGTYTDLDGESMIDTRFALAKTTRQPTFNLLKQWANMVDDRTTAQEVVAPEFGVLSSSSSNPQHGLHPIITQGAVAMTFSYQRSLLPNSFNPVYIFIPQIQILNPHNVPLKAQDYIVQIGYQFVWWMRADGKKGSNKATFDTGRPEFHSWEVSNGQEPLPAHIPADNEEIQYQNNKRFFTFVIKNQAFEPGESLIFYAKPPETGKLSGVEYNLTRDTDILNGGLGDDELNLLWNEGSLEDSFFYVISPRLGSFAPSAGVNLNAQFDIESNFNGSIEGTGLANTNDLAMHLNLYAVNNGKPTLLHATTKSQTNSRKGGWKLTVYPLDYYQDGIETVLQYPNGRADFPGKNPLINFGSSLLTSNFDIFAGGGNTNLPPFAGQPHATLGIWNIRNQESFSTSDEWAVDLEASSWLNSFSFRDIPAFLETWQYADSLYGNPSTDRLGGWWQSAVQGMAFPLFDYPTSPYGPVSLGSFQHANLSVYGWQPTYAFGNAQAPPRFDRSLFKDTTYEDLYDVSYLLNASTWDSYYLSSIPQSGVALESDMRLPNSRHYLTSADGESALESARLTNTLGYDLSASSVLIHGGFNVNSTSLTAWQAFLSGAIGQKVQTLFDNTDSNVDTASAMGRFLAPLLDEPSTVAADRNTTDFEIANSWAATRTLNADEISTLAERIVEEVKRRGPFLSLADFVNRRLEPDTNVTGDELVYQEVLGTLQAAINKVMTEDQKINYHYYDFEAGGGSNMTIRPSVDWMSLGGFSVTSDAQESMFGLPRSKIASDGGLIHNYAPNFLSQADVLTKIGPSITVRGDTFVIRSYGDSRNQIADKVVSEAWCEAVVQRVATPIDWDGTDEQLIQTQALDDVTTPDFGRHFKLLSFRWLTKQEIMPYSDDGAI